MEFRTRKEAREAIQKFGGKIEDRGAGVTHRWGVVGATEPSKATQELVVGAKYVVVSNTERRNFKHMFSVGSVITLIRHTDGDRGYYEGIDKEGNKDRWYVLDVDVKRAEDGSEPTTEATKVSTKFKIIADTDDHQFPIGSKVQLILDDGSNMKRYKGKTAKGEDREAWVSDRNLVAHVPKHESPIGTKFKVVGNTVTPHNISLGSIVTLIFKDGTKAPKYEDEATGKTQFIHNKDLKRIKG